MKIVKHLSTENDAYTHLNDHENYRKLNGKCFEKRLEAKFQKFALFTGDEDYENVDLVPKVIITKPGSTKWVKKKADNECVSADPDDCLIWCLVETPEEVETIMVLADTTQTDNFEWIKYEITESEREFWTEVKCR